MSTQTTQEMAKAFVNNPEIPDGYGKEQYKQGLYEGFIEGFQAATSQQGYVKSFFRQTEESAHDYLGELCEQIGKLGDDVSTKSIERSNDKLVLIKRDNRTIGFVIETRTEFNDIEFIVGKLNSPF